MMFKDLNLNKKDKYYLLFILLFSMLLVTNYIYFNVNLGISCSDVYLYLLNALYFTGTNIGATENIFLSPLVCFLTSILFRSGLVDKIAIFIVTGALAIFGNIGLYLLLKQYFDEIYSLAGVIIYSTLSLNLTWLANGTLDIPAVSFTIWLALFSIIAIKKNPKFYTYAMIILVLGFFTRYTVVLAIPPILLYYVYEKGFKITPEDKKHIIKAVIIGLVIGMIILSVVLIMGHGQFGAGQQFINRATGISGSERDPAFNPDFSYYLVNLPNFISNSHTVFKGNPVLESPTVLSLVFFSILIIGTVLWLKNNKSRPKDPVLPVALFLISFLIFTKVTSLITIFLVMVGLYIIGKDSDNKVALIMLLWILSNMIFFSHYNIKVNRYIIPIFPALIYFLIRALDIIKDNVKINKNIIPIILIILFAVQGFAFTQSFEPTNEYISTEEISDYIMEINPDYQDIPIGTYNLRPYRWWIGSNIIGIPSTNHNAIDKSNITYYISNTKLTDLQNFTEIKNINNLYLYERINT